MLSVPHNEFATAHIRTQEPILPSGVGSVHTTLACIHGVRSVSVSLDAQEAKVLFDLYEINPLQFKRALFIIGMTIDTIILTFEQEQVSPPSGAQWRGARSGSDL